MLNSTTGSGSRKDGMNNRQYATGKQQKNAFLSIANRRLPIGFGRFENIYIFVSSNNQSYFLTAKIN